MSDRYRGKFHYLPLPLPKYGRRAFLQRLGEAGLATTALSMTTACSQGSPSQSSTSGNSNSGNETDTGGNPVTPDSINFLHGVASGDPLTDRVILWTRVTPPAGSSDAISVSWLISASADLSSPVSSGQFLTNAERDYTVKVDAAGLASYSTYYYQFSVIQSDGSVATSPVGRTKTAPSASDDVSQLRIASASCNQYTFGHFNAFSRIGERADLDLVIHLGDYIYEGGGSQVRAHEPPHEILTLEDYRIRHAQYKTDPGLQAAHRQHPWITTIDDHETTNNSYSTGASNHTEGHPDDGGEGFWNERVGWALRAYFEWMPIRDNGSGFDAPAAGEPRQEVGQTGLLATGLGKLYKRVAYGELVDIIMLDTRLAGRVEEDTSFPVSEEQTILGEDQRQWFLNELANSSAKWKVIGNGTAFAPLIAGPVNPLTGCTSPLPTDPPCYVNQDAWDGYQFDRNAVFDVLENNAITNSVFIFGDIHAVIACDLPRVPNDPTSYNPLTGEGSLGVELCCGGVAQVPVPVWTGLMLNGENPHMKHAQETRLGYMLMDITPARVQAEWYYSLVQTETPFEALDPVMLQTADGSQRLTNALTPSTGPVNPPALAP